MGKSIKKIYWIIILLTLMYIKDYPPHRLRYQALCHSKLPCIHKNMIIYILLQKAMAAINSLKRSQNIMSLSMQRSKTSQEGKMMVQGKFISIEGTEGAG